MISLTKYPAHDQTLIDGEEVLTGSGGAIEVNELEDVDTPLQEALDENTSFAFYILYSLGSVSVSITSVTNSRCSRKLEAQTMRTKISCFTGA